MVLATRLVPKGQPRSWGWLLRGPLEAATRSHELWALSLSLSFSLSLSLSLSFSLSRSLSSPFLYFSFSLFFFMQLILMSDL